MNKIRVFFAGKGAPRAWEWFLLGLLFLLPFLSYFYGDTMSILKYEVNFMGSLTEGGGWRSYYEYNRLKVENGGPNGYGNYATYDYPMYLVLGIWGIPLWFFSGFKRAGSKRVFPFENLWKVCSACGACNKRLAGILDM